MISTNTVVEIRFVRAGEVHMASCPGKGFWHEPAPEDGYDVVLADSRAWVPESALLEAKKVRGRNGR